MLRLATGLVALAVLAISASSADAAPGRVFAARAGADAEVSSNWAGYAVTGANPDGTPTTYTDVTGSWVQPTITCTRGNRSYSAFWVGLGGFSSNSQALEQLGTESNCDGQGHPAYDAWWEIVPAPSTPLKLKINPGDSITAAVLVKGTEVTLQLTNNTRRTRATKRISVAAPDLTSAEWIAEAPSTCTSAGQCTPLPLANFGSVSFAHSAATDATHAGTINDPAWNPTAIELAEQSTANPSFMRQPTSPSGAVTSDLSADGRAFSVVWHPASA